MSNSPNDDTPPPNDGETSDAENSAPNALKSAEREANGRIKKGSSGNPKGRPREKVRAFSKQALALEIIAEVERPIWINGKKTTAIQVMIQQLVHDAIKGDRNARDHFWRLHDAAIEEVQRTNPELNKMRESYEKFILDRGLSDDRVQMEQLYEVRKRAKSL